MAFFFFFWFLVQRALNSLLFSCVCMRSCLTAPPTNALFPLWRSCSWWVGIFVFTFPLCLSVCPSRCRCVGWLRAPVRVFHRFIVFVSALQRLECRCFAAHACEKVRRRHSCVYVGVGMGRCCGSINSSEVRVGKCVFICLSATTCTYGVPRQLFVCFLYSLLRSAVPVSVLWWTRRRRDATSTVLLFSFSLLYIDSAFGPSFPVRLWRLC